MFNAFLKQMSDLICLGTGRKLHISHAMNAYEGGPNTLPKLAIKIIIMSLDLRLLHITTGRPQASLCKSRSGPVTHRAHSALSLFFVFW